MPPSVDVDTTIHVHAHQQHEDAEREKKTDQHEYDREINVGINFLHNHVNYGMEQLFQFVLHIVALHHLQALLNDLLSHHFFGRGVG